MRGAVGTPDRGHTAASQLKPGDFDWDHIFGQLGVRWLHTGGIFAALSETTAQLTIQAIQATKSHGAMVSYDLNYRPSLWKSIGGKKKAQEVNREIARYVDVMIGNEEDFTDSLGFEAMIGKVVADYPNFLAIATTLRAVRSATVNAWSAVLWHDGAFHSSRACDGLEIMDRVGGGDSFASGLIYGFLKDGSAADAVNYGAAHGALAMTTPGIPPWRRGTRWRNSCAGSARVPCAGRPGAAGKFACHGVEPRHSRRLGREREPRRFSSVAVSGCGSAW